MLLVIAIYGCCFHLSTMQNSWSISIENVARIKGLEAFCRILKGFCGVLRADLRLWIHPLRWRWLVDVVVDYSIIFWFCWLFGVFPHRLIFDEFCRRWTVNGEFTCKTRERWWGMVNFVFEIPLQNWGGDFHFFQKSVQKLGILVQFFSILYIILFKYYKC